MTSNSKSKIILGMAAVLVIILACGSGYVTTRTSTRNQGQIELKMASLDGADETEIEIDDNFIYDTVLLDITIEVEAGSYRVEIKDEDGQILELEATPGNPGVGRRNMVTDGLGKIPFNAQGEGAQNITITIVYSKVE